MGTDSSISPLSEVFITFQPDHRMLRATSPARAGSRIAQPVSMASSTPNVTVTPIMLTDDYLATADAVGKIVGMEVRAELLPENKLEIIKQLNGNSGGISKVGNDINDAPALAVATVGIAMGSGTDVALQAADAAVLNNRITDVADLIRLSRRTMAVIRQNVALALKAIFLVTTVVGATGLWIAILADTGATVLVTTNALRLLKSI
jgi:Cd2+/Zn2+-exporting ATPase